MTGSLNSKSSSEKDTMSVLFFPSLSHRTLSKTAIRICNEPEIRISIYELNYLWDKSNGEETWKGLLDKADQKIQELHLPPLLHQSVMALVKPIALEIARWKDDHTNILGHEFDFIGCKLYWTPEGVIDRIKTAKTLVQNKSLCKVKRFFMACFYCFEKEVKAIWNIMTSEEERRTYDLNHFSCVTFWRSCLHRKEEISWSTLSGQVRNHLYRSNFLNYQDNPVWLRGFFHKLSSEDKKECISYTVNSTFKDHDNFRFSVSQLNEKERESVFSENPVRLLRFFLDWPNQSLFSEAAEKMWKYLQEADFRRLLHFLIYNRIVADWYDYDYISLLKEFWSRSPKHFKDYIRKDPMFFEAVKMVVFYDFLKVFPKEEIRHSRYHIELPEDKDSVLRDGDFEFSW